MPTSKSLIPIERIEKVIYLIHGHKVMLDTDLAELYDVETRILVRNVKRNIDRFPKDFMFQLTKKEDEVLRSQIGISKKGWGGRRYAPYVFTEQGVAMLSSVLNSKRAIQVNVEIMRAFVRMRQLLASHKGLMQKISDMEKKYDKQFQVVFKALKQLMVEEEKPRPQIGFTTKGNK